VTSRERILATIEGKPTDRIPVYTQIPFAVDARGFKPGAFHGYEDHDDWRERDPEYIRLVQRMEGECDNFFIWRPPCMLSDPFFIPLSMTRIGGERQHNGRIETTQVLEAGELRLTQKRAVQPGTGHTWQLEHYCKTPDDARGLLELPWEGHRAQIADFFEIERLLGNRGVIWVTVPSPLLVVCRLFDPMEFLILAATERKLMDRLMETALQRIQENLKALLEAGAGPIIRFGGAEHATPPLLSPRDFDWLVFDYDRPLMDLCKKHGRKVAVHCHGHIRHALSRFAEMGVDQTDPVETIPDGDLSLREARVLSANKITITGNIQMRELYSGTGELIGERVRQVIKEAGPDRLIITTTGTPLEKMSARLAENYHSLIDAALRYGMRK